MKKTNNKKEEKKKIIADQHDESEESDSDDDDDESFNFEGVHDSDLEEEEDDDQEQEKEKEKQKGNKRVSFSSNTKTNNKRPHDDSDDDDDYDIDEDDSEDKLAKLESLLAKKARGDETEQEVDVATEDEKNSGARLWVVAGSYEAALFGFVIPLEKENIEFRPVFMHASAHIGSIKTVAIQPTGNAFASGGSDDMIKLFDLRKLKELGSLMHHQGSVTKIAFYESTHMLSASEDKTINIWRATDWESLLPLKGHKNYVYDVSIHPSGRVALSVSKDKYLTLWNLMTGQPAFTKRLDFDPVAVQWSPSGEFYAIASQKEILLHNKEGKVTHTLKVKQSIHTITYITDKLIASGGEDKIVSLWNTINGSLVGELKEHTNRIRSIVSVAHPTKKDQTPYLISASSDGFIILWDVDKKSVIAKTDTQARLTCVSSIGLSDGAPLSLSASSSSAASNTQSAKKKNKKSKKSKK